jgi:hypothetical protein
MGYHNLAARHGAPIRPAPVMRIEHGVEAIVTDHDTYGQRYGATVIWSARKWD